MEKAKSYTSIWSVEKMIYAINDFHLPFPVTFQQIAVFLLTLFVMMFVPNVWLLGNVFIRYGAIPIGVAWGLSQKTFDGKRPLNFIRSVVLYLFRAKVTYADKKVELKEQEETGQITYVRGLENVSD